MPFNQVLRFGTWFGFVWFMGRAVGTVVGCSGWVFFSVCADGSHFAPPRYRLPRGSERAIRSSIVMLLNKCVDLVRSLGSGGSWEGLWGPLLGIRAGYAPMVLSVLPQGTVSPGALRGWLRAH